MKYCSACGAALDPGARFCPACRTSVSVSSTLASELRSGVQTEVRSILQSPSLQVPLLIWTTVIQFFWLFTDIAMLLFSVAGFVAAGMNNMFQQMISLGDSNAGWPLLMALIFVFITLVQVSFDATLIPGFLAFKPWAHGLFFWSCAPRGLWMLVNLIGLLIAAGESGSLSVASLLSFLALAGLFYLQIRLVRRSKTELAGNVGALSPNLS